MAKLIMNEYFQYMKNVAIRADAEREMIENQMNVLRKEGDYDSPKMEMLRQMKANIENPFTDGQWSALHAWDYTVRKDQEAEVLRMDDFLWEKDVAGFVLALREAGCEKFYYTNHSSSVMENIHGFIAAGCKMVGTVSWEEGNRFRTETVLGLEFTL